MPFRVGEALSGGGSVSMPPFRRFIRCGRCGRLSRHLQLVAGCLGICNSWPPAPASAIPGRRPRYTRVVIPLGRVGPYRSVFAGSGGSVSVGPPRLAVQHRSVFAASPPPPKKTTTASGGVVPRCGCRLVRRSGRTGPEPLYFLLFGASIMFIFLPSSLGIISTLAYSSRSVAKRSSRISPCSLKTIERPRKKT